MFKDFYELKPIELPKPKMKEVIPEEKELYDLLDKFGIKHETKYHAVIATIDQFEDLERKINGTICKGNFVNGKMQGHGKVITPEGQVIEGEFFDGKLKNKKK